MKIAFFAEHDPEDIRNFSGTTFHMLSHLRKVFDEVYPFQVPAHPELSKDNSNTRAVLEEIGNVATAQLKSVEHKVAAAICCGNSMVPFLKTKVPIVEWHDSTWAGLYRGHYGPPIGFEEFSTIHPSLHWWDKHALERCSLVIFSSQWAADLAQSDYGIDKSKIAVVTYGSNMPGSTSLDVVEQDALLRQKNKKIQLTFIGSDWVRKGLMDAIAMTESLIVHGIDAQLNVVGYHLHKAGGSSTWEHSLNQTNSHYINFIGFVPKTTDAGMNALTTILKHSHFLIHPAIFDCSPIVAVEACAHGVPVLGKEITGMPTLVKNGINGYLFPPLKFVGNAVAYVRHYNDALDEYRELVQTTFQEFRGRLNWDASCKKVRELVEALA